MLPMPSIILYILNDFSLVVALFTTTFADDNSSHHEQFSFKQLSVPTGLYFEKISPVRVFNTEWHIVYHMNLTELQLEFNQIVKSVKDVKNICSVLEQNYNVDPTTTEHKLPSQFLTRECGSTYDQIDLMLDDIKAFNMEWFYDIPQNRTKRAPLSIVGQVMKAIFGTLTLEDATEYLKKFDTMTKEGQHQRLMIDQQTTLIKSTIQLLNNMNEENKKLQNKTMQQLQLVNETLTLLHNEYENTWINMELQFQLQNLLLFVSMQLTSFQQKQKRILEAISFGSDTATVTPIILPPAILHNELDNIAKHVNTKNFDLPLPLNRQNMARYYQISSIRSRVVGDQLVMSMSIPLLTKKQYKLIKLTSFPNKLPTGLYNFIIPTHEYVAMDLFRESYISFSNAELANCHDLRDYADNTQIICMQSSPLVKISSERDDCGITLLSKNPKSLTCDNRLTNITNQVWIKLRQPNTYIGVFPQPQLVYIRCQNLPTTETLLSGTGIFTMKPDCQAKTDEILILAHTVYKTEIYARLIPSLQPHWNLNTTISQLQMMSMHKIKQFDTPNVISHGQLDELKRFSDSILQIQNDFQKYFIKKQNVVSIDDQPHNFFIYATYGMILIGTIYMMLCLLKHCNNPV